LADFKVKDQNDPADPNEYWEKVFANRRWGAYPAEDLVRFIGRTFRGVADKSTVRILEVGCGPGSNLWYLVREGFTVAGIDGSPTAIRQARERLTAEELPHDVPRVDLRVGNFATLPWPDLNFDAVVDIASLYANQMKTIRATTSEIQRVLKVGGTFFGRMFGTLTTGSESGELIEAGTRSMPTTGPCAGNEVAHFFTRPELEQLFASFKELGIDQTQRTDRNGAVQIFEWLVSAHR
jgi:ubiquinone/menaquinone biosynthesis C-methylase UbiE